jgi:hypothetical protein
MSASPHTFELLDEDGAVHTYVVTPHVGRAKYAVLFMIVSCGLGPLMQSLVAAQDSQGSTADILRSVDGSKLAADICDGIVRSGGLSTVIPLLLQHTIRDGKALNSESALDLAYTRNDGEAIQACMEVVAYNRFFKGLGRFFSSDNP